MALVRLKPYNPRRGYTLRRYTSLPLGLRFVSGKWYEVDDDKVDSLKEITQNGHTRRANFLAGEDSIAAFDIAMSKEEAREIEMGYATRDRSPEPQAGTLDEPVPTRVSRPGRKGPKPRRAKNIGNPDGGDAETRPSGRTPPPVLGTDRMIGEPTDDPRKGSYKGAENSGTPIIVDPSLDDGDDFDREFDLVEGEDGKLGSEKLEKQRADDVAAVVENSSAEALREKAEKLNLPHSGNKTDLARRIWNHEHGVTLASGDDESDDDA